MNKKLLIVICLGLFSSVFAQQNKGLKKIQRKYDNQMKELQEKCFQQARPILKDKVKIKALDDQCEQKEAQLNQNRSAANLEELQKIKQGKYRSKKILVPTKESYRQISESIPVYPSGLEGFKKEVANNFNTAVIKGEKVLRTNITFTVEKDGNISDVIAEGTDEKLNREAEIAVYLTKQKWQPAIENGKPQAYQFKMPMSFHFK